MTSRLAIAVTCCWLIMPKTAAAQVSGGELGIFAGTASGDAGLVQVLDARRSRSIRTSVDDRGTSVGLVFGGNFNPFIGVEMLTFFATNHYRAQLFDLGSERSSLDNNLFVFLMGNVVAHFAPGRVVPLISGGLGLAGTVDNSDRAYNFGGGVKLFVVPRVAIRVEGRRFVQLVTTTLGQVELVGRDLIEIHEPLNESVALMTFNVGISVFFGGR
jgi:hypothetical protein